MNSGIEVVRQKCSTIFTSLYITVYVRSAVYAYVVIVVEGGPLCWVADIQSAIGEGICQGLCCFKALQTHSGDISIAQHAQQLACNDRQTVVLIIKIDS